MSVLLLPRLYFSGQMYWNPSTLNNNDYEPPIDTYKIPQAELNTAYLETQGVETDPEFKKWVIEPIEAPTSGKYTYQVPPAEWNYYGGNQCGFVAKYPSGPDGKPIIYPEIEDPDNFGIPKRNGKACYTSVTGFTDMSGTPPNPSEPWLGLPLQLNLGMSPAKMVDVDPSSPFATQIFFDAFTLGSKDQGQGFSASVRQRMATRWLSKHTYNLDYKLMISGTYSAVFQNAFHKDDITFFDPNPAPGSLQAQLQEVLYPASGRTDVQGLMLRLTVYDTLYFQGAGFADYRRTSTQQERVSRADNRNPFMNKITELYRKYENDLRAYKLGRLPEAPNPPINRAYSYCVGWIGPWKEDELATAPGGRYLIPFNDLVDPPATGPDQIYMKPPNVPASYYQENPKGLSLGPVAVEVQPEVNDDPIKRISVDLGSAIPVLNTTGTRADFGTVQLGLQLSSGPLIIADLPYDKLSYEKTAGVVGIGTDIPFTNPVTQKEIASNPLFIQVFGSDQDKRVVALNESPFTAQTDTRGVYVDEPKPAWDSSAKPPTMKVKVWYYGGSPQANPHLAVSPSDDSVTLSYQDQGGQWQQIEATTSIPVPDNGEVSIQIEAMRPGNPLIQFYPFASGDPTIYENLSPFYGFYTAVRVLPFHNQRAVEFEDWLESGPDINQVNHFVFDQVYRTYHLMYPVMSFVSDPLKFQEWRGKIEQMTDPALFESARYMPVDRTLSAGQRRILKRYVDYLGELRHPTSVRSVSDRVTR